MKCSHRSFRHRISNCVGMSILCGATFAYGAGTKVPVNVYDFGPIIRCADVITAYDKNDENNERRLQIDSYVGGLLSGLNRGELNRMMAIRPSNDLITVDIGKKSSFEWRKSWLHSYCTDHPDAYLADATERLWEFMRDHHVGEAGTDPSH